MWRAAISISVACPCAPPNGWWIMISAFGNAKRLPFSPAVNKNEPIEAAIPITMVWTSALIKFMVSKIARPAVTLPPGELMYK